jgi:4-hydroxyphenylacetate 3-hydroxylase N terminal
MGRRGLSGARIIQAVQCLILSCSVERAGCTQMASMPLRTVQQYVESLRDNRTVYFRDQRVPDVTRHPVISVAVEHASIDYRLAEDPASRDLAVVTDVDASSTRAITRFHEAQMTC